MDKTQMTGVGIARCFQRPRPGAAFGLWVLCGSGKTNSSAAEAAPERKADPSTPLGMTGWVGQGYVGAEAPIHKAGGGVTKCFQRPRRCLSPATIPVRLRSGQALRFGRDDTLGGAAATKLMEQRKKWRDELAAGYVAGKSSG